MLDLRAGRDNQFEFIRIELRVQLNVTDRHESTVRSAIRIGGFCYFHQTGFTIEQHAHLLDVLAELIVDRLELQCSESASSARGSRSCGGILAKVKN